MPENEKLSCSYKTPLIAFRHTDKPRRWGVIQSNCNHWDCPLHGPEIAKFNYGRIVEGCRELSLQDHDLYMITLTSKGGGLSVRAAEQNYLLWTNRILTTLRKDAKRQGLHWAYMQVTERQKRGHPHSHIITTYRPDDLELKPYYKYGVIDGVKKRIWEVIVVDNPVETIEIIGGIETIVIRGDERKVKLMRLRSQYLLERCKSVGVGEQYDIQKLHTIEGASRYIAKYMFKETSLVKWPARWKRVRYSNNWYKYPENASQDAFPLLSRDDWKRLGMLATTISVNDDTIAERCIAALRGNDILINRKNVKDITI